MAPARSRLFVAEHDHSEVIDARFAPLGLRLTFVGHVDERDDFESSPVASRVSDLHAAFADPQVDGILTVIGGGDRCKESATWIGESSFGPHSGRRGVGGRRETWHR